MKGSLPGAFFVSAAMLAFFPTLLRRAREARLAQVAGSLTFTTLLSMVPLLAVSFALFTRFPIFRRLEVAIEQGLLGNLLPAEIGRTVLKHLGQFSANAVGLTWLGSLFLLATAVALLLTVENALNQIWQVRKARPFLRRVGVYLLLLAIGPPVVGVALLATSYAVAAATGWVSGGPPALRLAVEVAPLVLGAASMGLVFRLVPNAPVRRRHAAVGGLLASLGIEAGKRGFTLYLLHMPSYKAVYGTFATVPLFLLWLYFSWIVMLAAALVTATLGRGGKASR